MLSFPPAIAIYVCAQARQRLVDVVDYGIWTCMDYLALQLHGEGGRGGIPTILTSRTLTKTIMSIHNILA